MGNVDRHKESKLENPSKAQLGYVVDTAAVLSRCNGCKYVLSLFHSIR